jgi:hypothetical protein
VAELPPADPRTWTPVNAAGGLGRRVDAERRIPAAALDRA